MPSRKELRVILTQLTHESFVSGIPLDKTAYKPAEANQIQLHALISFNGLMHVDELLSKLNASTTNISSEQMRSYMRAVYMHAPYHNKATYDLVCSINKMIGERPTLGRNQAIELLLNATKESL